MSVAKEWHLRCPKCGRDDQLDIEALVMVRLTPDGTDADESISGDHTWGDDSVIVCAACDHTAKVKDFTIPDEARSSEP